MRLTMELDGPNTCRFYDGDGETIEVRMAGGGWAFVNSNGEFVMSGSHNVSNCHLHIYASHQDMTVGKEAMRFKVIHRDEKGRIHMELVE